MSTATSATALMNSMELAEKDLALYAAIIGCRPTFDGVKADAGVKAGAPQAETAPAENPAIEESLADEDEAHHSHRISIWMRHVSHEAKRRIHEAAMRLAS